MLHLNTVVADAVRPSAAIVTRASRSPSSPSRSPPSMQDNGDDNTVHGCSDAPVGQETNSNDGAADASIRRAVTTHGRLLSQALHIFDMVVADGRTTKAVINGPVSDHRQFWVRTRRACVQAPLICATSKTQDSIILPPPRTFSSQIRQGLLCHGGSDLGVVMTRRLAEAMTLSCVVPKMYEPSTSTQNPIHVSFRCVSVRCQARTAVAVASLQALAEITANVADSVGRKAFSNVRTGQLLLSILAREHSSAVLQVSLAPSCTCSFGADVYRATYATRPLFAGVTSTGMSFCLLVDFRFAFHIFPTNAQNSTKSIALHRT